MAKTWFNELEQLWEAEPHHYPNNGNRVNE